MTTTVVVMGVAGTGKSTVAKELSRRSGWVFAEGDEFHPQANVAKMTAGIPLDDDDRWPWLRSIAAWIGERERAGEDAVVTCSALKRAYRDLLRDGHPSVWFAHVATPPRVLEERMRNRKGHFMPPSLLPSQLAMLEQLAPDEPGVVIVDEGTPEDVVDHLVAALPEDVRAALPEPPPPPAEPLEPMTGPLPPVPATGDPSAPEPIPSSPAGNRRATEGGTP